MLRFADDLVGSSSMMPQKRNPFLLESIQGKATASLGHYVSAATAMTTAGYTNAISVGTEAIRQLWPGLQDTTDAATLLRLVINGATPDRHQMLRRAAEGFTAATHYAERLTAGGMPFRTAHHHVGRAVLAAIGAGTPLQAPELDEMDLDPAAVMAAASYGGGPGGCSVEHAATMLRADLEEQHTILAARTERWAAAARLLDQAVSQIMALKASHR
jgi:argininosuccinate lyase